MATERTRDVEDQLADSLDRIIGWLQFAESKNLGIVGLIATFLGLIVSFSLFGPRLPSLAAVGLAVGGLMLMISLLLAVISFLPVTDLGRDRIAHRGLPGSEANLVFYGHLARYEPDALVRAVTTLYGETPPDEVMVSKFALDLAEQIVTTARITVRKLRLYRSAMLLFASGILLAAAAMALAAFGK